MPDDKYRLGESLRLIGKGLDHKLDPPERSERILELMRVLSEIDVPARRDNGASSDNQPAPDKRR
jgi:hypothetical protein